MGLSLLAILEALPNTEGEARTEELGTEQALYIAQAYQELARVEEEPHPSESALPPKLRILEMLDGGSKSRPQQLWQVAPQGFRGGIGSLNTNVKMPADIHPSLLALLASAVTDHESMRPSACHIQRKLGQLLASL